MSSNDLPSFSLCASLTRCAGWRRPSHINLLWDIPAYSFQPMTDAVTSKLEDLDLKAKEPQTVLDNTADFSVIHPLNYEWTLWYTKPPVVGNEAWSDLLKQLVTVGSVEEFWGAFNSVPKISELPQKSDFGIFRKNVRPEWEDPVNAKGGKWIYQLRPTHIAGREVDEKCLNVILQLVGGTLDNEDPEDSVVTGLFVLIRNYGTKVTLWVKEGHESHRVTAVAKRFKEALGLKGTQTIEFQQHDQDRFKKSNAILL